MLHAWRVFKKSHNAEKIVLVIFSLALVLAITKYGEFSPTGNVVVQPGFGNSWYDVNYNYRTNVTVTNTLAQALTNVQVPIDWSAGGNAIGDGKLNGNCTDVRVVDHASTPT